MSQPPDALLLLTSQCPNCPTVLAALSELVKSGTIGRLEVINLNTHPEAAEDHGVRAVPWLRLGPFELTGLRSLEELRRWAQRAGSEAGMADYLAELLTSGELPKATGLAKDDATARRALIKLAGNPDTNLNVRLGIGAIMEDLAGSPALQELVPDLAELTRHQEAHIRNDACHYLGLSQAAAARPYITALLDDADPQVREVAEESLANLPK